MNTDHDLIYGAYKICEDEPKFCPNYNRMDMEHFRSDIYAQTWKAVFGMADPEDQIQYFKAIIMWLLELHSPLRRYIISTNVNPWFIFDVEKAMVERNIAYRVWKRRKTAADRTRTASQLFGA
jgi:hypothetical protein